MKLDKEEKEILEYFEKGNFKINSSDLERHKKYAGNTLIQHKTINIKISLIDLEGIQKKAIEKGLSYQSLISNIIHSYVSGELIEKV